MKSQAALYKLNSNAARSYKIGVDEIQGLKAALVKTIKPIRDALRAKAYWHETLECSDLEYKSRDGFIPYSSNHGGVELGLHVPECESCDWGFLGFGEADIDPETQEPYENEGELDAYLRIIIKFEGIDDETGELKFYVNVSGGNEDAPYFRVSRMSDLYQGEFTAKSVMQIQAKAKRHVAKILKLIGGAE